MTEQTTAAAQAAENEPAQPLAFSPQISTHPAAVLTLGRQSFNDSDKTNYFEG